MNKKLSYVIVEGKKHRKHCVIKVGPYAIRKLVIGATVPMKLS